MSVDPPITVAPDCRRCGAAVGHLPPSAMYCPHCGGGLAPSAGEAFKARIQEFGRGSLRFALALMCRRARSRTDTLTGNLDRSKIITGYGNAMYKLGWRYERHRNLPEAIRCYFKSSKLGNPDAIIRLAPAEQRLPDEDRSRNAPLPVMHLWRSWTPPINNDASRTE